jgi:ABC-type lipoprotein export system ATPase subunit
LKRVEKFLTENLSQSQEINAMNNDSKIFLKNAGIFMKNVSAYWKQNDRNSLAGITNIEFKMMKPGLVVVIGHVGSGKTSLLQVLLKV